MQQSPIVKKLQSGSIFCFWFLGTASRGCHGWNDSGLAHAPSGKPVKNTMERHRIIPTERCTGATRGRHCGLFQMLRCAKHNPIDQINPRHTFGLYCYSSLNREAARRRPLAKSIYWVYPCSFLYRRLLVSSQLSMVPVS